MNSFQYTAWTIEGLKSGLVDREDAIAVSQWLESQGWVPVEVRACRVGKPVESARQGRGSVNSVDLVMLSRQLEVLLNADVPLVRSLSVAAGQTQSRRLSAALLDVRTSIEQGSLLSDALEARPNIFPGIFTNLVRAGELGGRLPEMLSRLGRLLENEDEMRRKLKSAGSTPGMVVAGLGLAFAVLIKFVLPRIAGLSRSRGADLPLPTRILLSLSSVGEKHGLAIMGLLIALGIGLVLFLRTSRGRDLRDDLLIRIPLLGPIHHKMAQSRFARILSPLLTSGVPLLTAVEVSARACGNRAVAKAVLRSRSGISEGLGLAESLEASRVFSPLLLRMIAVGAETGDLDRHLDRAAGYHDLEVDYAIRNLSAAIQPVLLVAAGAFVLWAALAVTLPLWNLMSAFQR